MGNCFQDNGIWEALRSSDAALLDLLSTAAASASDLPESRRGPGKERTRRARARASVGRPGERASRESSDFTKADINNSMPSSSSTPLLYELGLHGSGWRYEQTPNEAAADGWGQRPRGGCRRMRPARLERRRGCRGHRLDARARLGRGVHTRRLRGCTSLAPALHTRLSRLCCGATAPDAGRRRKNTAAASRDVEEGGCGGEHHARRSRRHDDLFLLSPRDNYAQPVAARWRSPGRPAALAAAWRGTRTRCWPRAARIAWCRCSTPAAARSTLSHRTSGSPPTPTAHEPPPPHMPLPSPLPTLTPLPPRPRAAPPATLRRWWA